MNLAIRGKDTVYHVCLMSLNHLMHLSYKHTRTYTRFLFIVNTESIYHVSVMSLNSHSLSHTHTDRISVCLFYHSEACIVKKKRKKKEAEMRNPFSEAHDESDMGSICLILP